MLFKKDFWTILELFIVSLGFYSLYDYVFINITVRRYFNLFCLLWVLFFVFKHRNTFIIKSNFSNLITGLIAVYILSAFMALIYRGQDLISGVIALIPNLYIFLFFFFNKKNLQIEQIEKLIKVLLITYIVIWMYSVTQIPNLIFGISRDGDLENNSRGFFRLFIPGLQILPLSMFYFFNKFSLTKSKKWLFISIVLLVAIVLHVRRQMIIWSVLLFLFYVLRHYKYNYKAIVALLIVLIFGLYSFNSKSPLRLMYDETVNQVASKRVVEKDIRIKAIEFYATEYSISSLNIIFGNGMPYVDTFFGKYNKSLQKKGLYKSDIGWFGLYADFGLVGVVLYILIFIKLIKQKVSQERYYAKIFLIYVYFSFLFNHTLTSSVLLVSIALYVLDLDYQRKYLMEKLAR